MRRRNIAAAVAGWLVAAGSASGQLTLDHPRGKTEAYPVDAGPFDNPASAWVTVHQEVVDLPGAAWLRLYFGQSALPGMSFVRVTSLEDGEVQELDPADLAMWSNTSAYFNGSALLVELVAGPNTAGARLVIDRVAFEEGGGVGGAVYCGICGGSDSRVASSEDWSGRIMPVGCTGSVYNETSCVVSAGHCMGDAGVIQFRVPASNPDCSVRHPPVAEQFPIVSMQFQNAGVGADWAVMTTGTNSLGERAYDRYGVLRPISDVLGSPGDTVGVWGYAIDDECVKSQTQQTHSGPINSRFSSYYTYTVDVTFGNSGSGLIRAGKIIGVVTHCSDGCPNYATRVDLAAFATARRNVCPCAADFNGDGTVNSLDVLDFLLAFNNGDRRADMNGDGFFTSLDVLIFLNVFNTPC